MHGSARRWMSALLTAGLVLFLGATAFILLRYQPFAIPSPSMLPTLQIGDRILADRWDPTPQHGDIVVFSAKAWGAKDSSEVKRVLGISGDKISCASNSGQLLVNGSPVSEPYLKQSELACGSQFDVVVPEGRVFLLGDNRNSSLDSRAHLNNAAGTVPASDIQAKYAATIFPLDHLAISSTNGFIRVLFGGVALGLLLIAAAAVLFTAGWARHLLRGPTKQ